MGATPTRLKYGAGIPVPSFFTPAFLWNAKETEGPNLVVFRNPSFAAKDPDEAVALGVLADVCGYTGKFELKYAGHWAFIEMTSGPFALGEISNKVDKPEMSMGIVIIQGPILDRLLKANAEAQGEDE